MQYGVILPQEYVEKKELAIACKRAGDYSRAIDLYWEVMQAYPADADQYKGRAKVEICRGAYNEAMYALNMWMELSVYTIRAMGMAEYKLNSAIRNIATFGIDTIRIKDFNIPIIRILKMAESDTEVRNALLLAGENKDPYLMMGFCYAMMFPRDIAHYQIPREFLENYKNILGGHNTGMDFRNTPYESVIYSIGLLMAIANVRGDIDNIEDEKAIHFRWDRRPTYAIVSHTFTNKDEWRQNNMQFLLDRTCQNVREKFSCHVVAGKSMPLKAAMTDDHYSLWIDYLCDSSYSPLTVRPTWGERRTDLLACRDVYTHSMFVELSEEDDYDELAKTDSLQRVTMTEIGEWVVRHLNRAVLCQGWQKFNGIKFRQFHWFDIIQI